VTLLAAAPIYWHLPFMLLVISIVYSATRFDDWDAILYETFRWGSRMLGFMAAIAVVLCLGSWWI
jgi:integral membrane sensor domain MASE1